MANQSHDSTRKTDPRDRYQPITVQDVRQGDGSAVFEGLESSSARTLGGILFFVIFVVSRNLLQVSALILVVLLGCLLYRMDKRERQIAAIPLTFAAIRLAFQMSEQLSLWHISDGNAAALAASRVFDSGIHWLPLFFSAYLFYSPWKQSHTSRLVFWSSMIMVLSGLLPGEGYLYICSILFYTAFIGILVTLVLDFHSRVFDRGSVATEQGTQAAVS